MPKFTLAQAFTDLVSEYNTKTEVPLPEKAVEATQAFLAAFDEATNHYAHEMHWELIVRPLAERMVGTFAGAMEAAERIAMLGKDGALQSVLAEIAALKGERMHDAPGNVTQA